jgi:hypothetical protein
LNSLLGNQKFTVSEDGTYSAEYGTGKLVKIVSDVENANRPFGPQNESSVVLTKTKIVEIADPKDGGLTQKVGGVAIHKITMLSDVKARIQATYTDFDIFHNLRNDIEIKAYLNCYYTFEKK